jgi:hypothetical protein
MHGCYPLHILKFFSLFEILTGVQRAQLLNAKSLQLLNFLGKGLHCASRTQSPIFSSFWLLPLEIIKISAKEL